MTMKKTMFVLLCAIGCSHLYAQKYNNPSFNGINNVNQYSGATLDAKLNACITSASQYNGGICDARSIGSQYLAGNINVTVANVVIYLPCAQINTAYSIIVSAGIRNTRIEGCSYQGGSTANGTFGGTVWVYTGSGNAIQVGDPTYIVDTKGFQLTNINLNTAGAGSSAVGIYFYRTQEIRLDNLYLNGNQSTGQEGIVLDGTGNYSGGTFIDEVIDGFGTGWYLTGHLSGTVLGDYANASTFVKTHVDCPTSSGSPISGTYGINVVKGDGNTWVGGDVEGCSTMFHLGANAENNTVDGLRNENSTIQYQADTGSTYNAVFTGGTLFTGDLIDNGSRNSFWDAFHRTVNGINGDWYASQKDATVTDHQRLGTGVGNERGRSTEYQTDYGYRWSVGLSDGTPGQQTYYVQDLINNLFRLSIGQYLSATANVVTNVILNNGGCYSSSTPPTVGFTGGGGSGAAGTATMATSTCSGGYTVLSVTMTSGGSGYTSQPTVTWSTTNQVTAPNAVAEITTAGSTNDQTSLNSAGTGAITLNGSNGSGTGGVVIGSGGTTASAVANFDSSGNLTLLGQLNFYSGSTETWEWECNSLSACALQNANATTPGHVFKAFVNAGTDIDSQATSAVTINNTSTGGTGGFSVYEGGTNYNTVSFIVDGSGNTTVENKLVVGNHLNQPSANTFAGSCTMSGGSSCSFSILHSYSTAGLCVATDQGTNHYYGSCSISGSTVTITCSTSNSDTWAAITFGNPN